MTTINQTQTNSHNSWIPLVKTYTGTANQPDVVSIYLKSRHYPGHIKIVDEQIVNSLSHSPANFITAFPRIQKAIRIMFREIEQRTCFNENSEFWNAFKNGMRGIVQLVPLIGNVTLYIYDQLRTALYVHPKLKKELSDQQEVLGIAFDGKPVFSIPMSTVNPLYNMESKDADTVLALVKYIWLSLKVRCIENNSQITTRDLADRLRQMILTPQTTSSSL
jgi:hypothetical protein